MSIYQVLVCARVAVGVGRLFHQGAGELIGLAGSEVFVAHGVHDRHVALGHEVAVAVRGIASARANLGPQDADGLALVACVGMGRQGSALVAQLLEDHKLVALFKCRGIEGKRHKGLARLAVGREVAAGDHGFSIDQELLGGCVALGIRRLAHKDAGHGVAGVGSKPRVTYGVGHRGVRIAHDALVAVCSVLCGGGNLGLNHVDLLVGVVLIRVGRQHGSVCIQQRLVDDQSLADKRIGRDAKLHGHGSVGGLGHEGLLGNHGVARSVGQDLARLRIGKLGLQGVLAPLHHMREAHGVLRDGVSAGQVLVAIGGVSGHSVDFGLGVVQSAQVKRFVVARYGDLRGDQHIALVGGAAKLLKLIGVARQGGKAVDGRGAQPKPGSRRGVQARAVDGARLAQGPIVAIGIGDVRVPICGAGEEPVLVGDDNVGLAGGGRRQLEGDVGQPVAAVVGALGELDVAAISLLGKGGGVIGHDVFGRRLLDLLEGGLGRDVVPARRLGLAHDHAAARQARQAIQPQVKRVTSDHVRIVQVRGPVRIGLEHPGALGCKPRVRKRVVRAVVERVVVLDGELGVCQRRIADRGVVLRVIAQLGVVLLQGKANRVGCGLLAALEGAGLAAGHGQFVNLVAKQVAGRSFGLFCVVGAGKQLQRVAGAIFACGEAAHLGGAVLVLKDVVDGPRQRVAGVACGQGLVGRGLLQLCPGITHGLGALYRCRLVELARDLVDLVAQLVAQRRLGLFHVIGFGQKLDGVRFAVLVGGESRHALLACLI